MVANEEGMIKDFFTEDLTWTVEGRKPCWFYQSAQRIGLKKYQFEMGNGYTVYIIHQKESQAQDAIVEVNTQESQRSLR